VKLKGVIGLEKGSEKGIMEVSGLGFTWECEPPVEKNWGLVWDAKGM
jgi:hypothetical protein